jgi:hypothetical protein
MKASVSEVVLVLEILLVVKACGKLLVLHLGVIPVSLDVTFTVETTLA